MDQCRPGSSHWDTKSQNRNSKRLAAHHCTALPLLMLCRVRAAQFDTPFSVDIQMFEPVPSNLAIIEKWTKPLVKEFNVSEPYTIETSYASKDFNAGKAILLTQKTRYSCVNV